MFLTSPDASSDPFLTLKASLESRPQDSCASHQELSDSVCSRRVAWPRAGGSANLCSHDNVARLRRLHYPGQAGAARPYGHRQVMRAHHRCSGLNHRLQLMAVDEFSHSRAAMTNEPEISDP